MLVERCEVSGVSDEFVECPGHVAVDDAAPLAVLDPAKRPNFGRLLRESLTETPFAQDDFKRTLDMLIRGLIAEADKD